MNDAPMGGGAGGGAMAFAAAVAAAAVLFAPPKIANGSPSPPTRPAAADAPADTTPEAAAWTAAARIASAPALAAASGVASANASACGPAAVARARHAHSNAAAGAAASCSPGTCPRSCSACSRKTWRTPISTRASARRGDTPWEEATQKRAASSASRAPEASPPLAFAAMGVTASDAPPSAAARVLGPTDAISGRLLRNGNTFP